VEKLEAALGWYEAENYRTIDSGKIAREALKGK